MGTPNRLDIVYGRLRVDIEAMTAKERYELFQHRIMRCRAHLGHIQGFQEIGELWPAPEAPQGDTGIAEFHRGIRCMLLSELVPKEKGSVIRHGKLFLVRDSARLVIWQLTMRPVRHDPEDDYYTPRADCLRSKFIAVDEMPRPEGVFTPAVLASAFHAIQEMLYRTVRQRQQHLNNVSDLSRNMAMNNSCLRYKGRVL